MISGKDIEVLRAIARAGEDHRAVKRLLLRRPKWVLEQENDSEFPFFGLIIPDAADFYYRLDISCGVPEQPPHTLLTFYAIPPVRALLPGFNKAFRCTAQALDRHLGRPDVTGKRPFRERSWTYAYRRWSLPEGEFTLVQDEFDGEQMDITLWLLPPGTPLKKILKV